MRNKFYARAWSILRPLVLFFRPVELRGTENLEDGAAILCANHSSAWDPILLVLAMPQNFNVRIMAKKQLFSIPVVGWFLRNIGVFTGATATSTRSRLPSPACGTAGTC